MLGALTTSQTPSSAKSLGKVPCARVIGEHPKSASAMTCSETEGVARMKLAGTGYDCDTCWADANWGAIEGRGPCAEDVPCENDIASARWEVRDRTRARRRLADCVSIGSRDCACLSHFFPSPPGIPLASSTSPVGSRGTLKTCAQLSGRLVHLRRGGKQHHRLRGQRALCPVGYPRRMHGRGTLCLDRACPTILH